MVAIIAHEDFCTRLLRSYACSLCNFRISLVLVWMLRIKVKKSLINVALRKSDRITNILAEGLTIFYFKSESNQASARGNYFWRNYDERDDGVDGQQCHMVDHYKILKEKGVEEKRQQLIFIWNFKRKWIRKVRWASKRYEFALRTHDFMNLNPRMFDTNSIC